LFTLWA